MILLSEMMSQYNITVVLLTTKMIKSLNILYIHILRLTFGMMYVYKDIQETNANTNTKRQNPANPITATTKQKTHNRHALYG